MRTTRIAIVAATAAMLAPAALAACATDAEVEAFVASYRAGTPAVALGANGDLEDALCTQDKLGRALASVLGPVVGYKAGLTSAPAQERFGATGPVRGLLFRDTMLADGASLPQAFGAVPLMEADLVLVVGDAAIGEATDAAGVMANVSAVHPFIELPDLMLEQGEPMNAETITAMAVGPRFGVLGAAIPVDDPAAMAEALGTMTVTMRAADGTVLAQAPGAAVLGHPAEAVLFLLRSGVTLLPGDLVSVGSFGPLVPPAQAGGAATVRYEGLPGDPTVSVRFTR